MSEDLKSSLQPVRAEIDDIDARLVELLNRRARCAQRVGEIKAQHGEAGFIYRPEREAQVLRRLQEINPGPLSNESVTWFFREVMSACLSLERPLAIAFLGPLGTFSESASTNSSSVPSHSSAASTRRFWQRPSRSAPRSINRAMPIGDGIWPSTLTAYFISCARYHRS